MSDYLSSLAARSLRREPACEPRRAQMFEPRQETPDSPFVEEVREVLPAVETFERGTSETPAPTAPRAPRAPAVYERDDSIREEPRAQTHTQPAHTAPTRVEGDEPGPDSQESPRRAEAPRPSVTTQPVSSPPRAFQTEAAGEPPAPHAPRDVKVIPQTPPITPSSSADVHIEDVADTPRPLAPSRPSSSRSATQTAPPADSEETPHELPSTRHMPARSLRADVFDEERREQAPAVVPRASKSPQSAETPTRTDSESLPVGMPRALKATPSTDVRPFDEVRLVPAQPSTPNSPAAAAREVSAQTQPPPTIEVSIGRIEVRAVTPPAPPVQPRQRQAPPKMSLDDYLRAQSGGRS